VNAFNTSLTLASTARTKISDGIALINTLHTTCALFIHEFQSALVEDFRALIERLVPDRNGYRHDDPRFSDCERGNARAHLRAALLGRTLVVGVNNDDLTLGQFQSVIAEPSGRTRADR